MRNNSRPNLSNNTRNAVAQFLLQNVNAQGKPAHGKMNEAARKWGIGRRTVHNIWSKAKQQMAEGLPIHLRNDKVGRQRPRLLPPSKEMVMAIKPPKRKSIRLLAESLTLAGFKVSKTTIARWLRSGVFLPHTNTVKPNLSAPNKLLRLKWSLRALQVDCILDQIKFRTMKSTIHIDEKWFFMTQATTRYYTVPGEEPTYRAISSKNHITKVMFVCAVGRPCYATSGEMMFDGKVGIFPLTNKVPAKRRSKNRPAGTLETKAIESVTREVYKTCLINEIIPSIKAKWPENASKDIILQQDNAKPHISNEDLDFRAAASADGFNMILVNQPPQSPDVNVNDLGWFRSIQSLQQTSPSSNIDDLVKAVENSFRELAPTTLNKVFLSLQACKIEILKQKGHNKYVTPHMKKDALIREGRLPVDLEVDETLVRECIDYLLQVQEVGGLEELMTSLGY